MSGTIPLRVVVVICLTVPPAIYQGRLTDRWGISDQQQNCDAFIRSFPVEIGDWSVKGDGKELSSSVLFELGITEYVNRIYSNGTDRIYLLYMSGKTSRLVRHSPDICYASHVNSSLTKPVQVMLAVDGIEEQVMVLPISLEEQKGKSFVVVYGFSKEGRFTAPQSPRRSFHGEVAIQKFQILCEADEVARGEIPEAAEDFLTQLFRVMRMPKGQGGEAENGS